MELMEIMFIVAMLLLIFGPRKLPGLARQLGEIVYEFRKTSSGVTASPAAGITAEANNALEDIARKLNIKTEGKTIKQITQQILMKIEGKTVEK